MLKSGFAFHIDIFVMGAGACMVNTVRQEVVPAVRDHPGDGPSSHPNTGVLGIHGII